MERRLGQRSSLSESARPRRPISPTWAFVLSWAGTELYDIRRHDARICSRVLGCPSLS